MEGISKVYPEEHFSRNSKKRILFKKHYPESIALNIFFWLNMIVSEPPRNIAQNSTR